MKIYQSLVVPDHIFIMTTDQDDALAALKALGALGWTVFGEKEPTTGDLQHWSEDSPIFWGSKDAKNLIISPGIYAETREIGIEDIAQVAQR